MYMYSVSKNENTHAHTIIMNVSTIECSCDTMDKLRKKSESLEREIRDPSKFKDLYQFTFSFAKNPGQKGLGVWRDFVIVRFCC